MCVRLWVGVLREAFLAVGHTQYGPPVGPSKLIGQGGQPDGNRELHFNLTCTCPVWVRIDSIQDGPGKDNLKLNLSSICWPMHIGRILAYGRRR